MAISIELCGIDTSGIQSTKAMGAIEHFPCNCAKIGRKQQYKFCFVFLILFSLNFDAVHRVQSVVNNAPIIYCVNCNTNVLIYMDY